MRSIGSDSEGDMMVGRRQEVGMDMWGDVCVVKGGNGDRCAVSFCIGGRLFWKGEEICGDRGESDAVRKK